MNASPKIFKPVTLSLAVCGLMYGLSTTQVLANDLDIYRPAVEGKATLVLMLDTSGSMGVDQVGASACDLPTNVTASSTSSIGSGTTPAYTKRFCNGSNSQRYFDRIARLKDAIFQLMDDPRVKSTTVMGLAQFSTQSNSANTTITADGVSGKIVVPARPLDATQRAAIKQAVANLAATGGTPTAQAYAEAAAYMMGTTTRIPTTIVRDEYRRRTSNGVFIFNLCSTYNAINYTTNRQTCNTWASNQSSQPSNAFTSTESRTISGTAYTVYLSNFASDTPGSGFNNSVSSSKSGAAYVSPLPTDPETKECNGQGIYFLTDGEPNTSNTMAVNFMQRALNNNSFSTAGGLPNDGALSNHAWPATGAFSKFLFDANKNPSNTVIKTAVVGYGSVFDGIQSKVRQNPDTGLSRTYYDCRTAQSNDSRNACNWGEKLHPDLPGVGGYGQGGFYSAATTAEIVQSVIDFVGDLGGGLGSVPTGAIVVPQDTLAPDTLQPFAYLPLLEPKPSTSIVMWPGNIKKYNVDNSTIEGVNGKPVFTGEGVFAKDTYDLWSVTKQNDLALLQAGGAFERLPLPTDKNTLERNAWLERSASSQILDQIKPTTAGMTALPGLTNWQRRYLLNFMGYNLPETGSLLDPANALPTTLTRPAAPFGVMGGVVHSTPQMMTYSADIKPDGTLSDNRDDSLLFGSLEGALHVINATTGVEQMAFIPRQIVDNQARALLKDSSGLLSPDKPALPSPTALGVDAPWAAYAEYSRKTNKIQADFMYAYGGMRMGGNAFYGLDLSDRNSPKILFNVTPSTSGFSRLGQTWGKPVITRIRHNNINKLVVIIGGGYDVRYEDPLFNPSSSTEMQGNAMYILDAKTGERLLTVGRSGANLNDANMRHSVVSRVKVLDRDSDGLTDHVYFADLGGQVFRVDLQNAPNTTVAKFGTRVVRLANLSAANGAGSIPPRFYEAPLVTIHDEGNKRFAVVNVGSGDRSNPLYDKNVIPNRIYAVIDRDIARGDLYSASITMNSQNIELTSLIEKPSTIAHQAAMLSDGSDRKNGWYFPLEAYGSIKAGLKGLKAYNEGAAISNDLYISVYNPNVVNNGASKCSAQVLGATELYRYCLPFGTCELQRYSLGQGIQAVNIGPGADPATRVILFQEDPKGGGGGDGVPNLEDPTKPGLELYSTPPQLIPLRWYEKQPKLK